MYNFSILIDDGMAADISEKIAISDSLKISNLEMEDRLEETDIADLDGEQVERIRNLLILHSRKIVLLNSNRPVTQAAYFKKLFRKAHLLGIEYVRVPVEATEWDEAFTESFREVCRTGKAYGIGVLAENNARTALAEDKSITRFYKDVGNGGADIIFNPLEYVRVKKHPFFHEFYNSKLKGNIQFLRVNDGLFVNGDATLPAQGNGEIKELASILLARGFKGYFSFTPYMKDMDEKDYGEVIKSFKKLLMQM